MKRKFYKYFNPRLKKYRIYYYPDFIANWPKEFRLIEWDELIEIRPDYLFIFNTIINRYMVYKRWKGLLVQIEVSHNPETLIYREPGEWLLNKLRKGDLFRGGAKDSHKAVSDFANLVSELDQAVVDYQKNMTNVYGELFKDFQWMLRGRASALVNTTSVDRKHVQKNKKKTITFIIGARTGRKLGKVVNGKLVEKYG